jgi:FkbM family methyltransferase
MKQRVKSLFKGALRSAGYDVRRRENVCFPYLRAIQFAGHSFDFWIANGCGRLWYEEVRSHMQQEADLLHRLVTGGERVLEMGCHHGFFTTMLAQTVGPAGYVCAVEASPENAMIAQAQITLNHLGGRASVLHAAGSDGPGSLNVRSENEGGNNHIVLGEDSAHVGVQAVTGDQLDSKYGPFTVLKIDVEGFETKVLKGCAGLLARRPRIAIEVHCAELTRYGSAVAEVIELLHLEDYEGFMLKRPAYVTERLDVNGISGGEPVNLFLTPSVRR